MRKEYGYKVSKRIYARKAVIVSLVFIYTFRFKLFKVMKNVILFYTYKSDNCPLSEMEKELKKGNISWVGLPTTNISVKFKYFLIRHNTYILHTPIKNTCNVFS